MDLAASHDLPTAIDLAWRRTCQALDHGHATATLRWFRVHARLKALLSLEPPVAPPPRRAATPPVQVPPAPTRWEKEECFFADSHARPVETARIFDAGPVHATGPPFPPPKPP